MNEPMKEPMKDEPWSCEVRARDQVIRYRCEGTGRSLIALHPGRVDPVWEELLAALARSYRVVVPEPPPAKADVAAWLDAFLEGLGGSGIRIVAADRFCMPAFEVTLVAADQIGRLVLLPEGPGDGSSREAVVGGTVETELASARIPLLVAHRGLPVTALVERVTRFHGPVGAALQTATLAATPF